MLRCGKARLFHNSVIRTARENHYNTMQINPLFMASMSQGNPDIEDEIANLKQSLAEGKPCYGYTFELDTDQTLMLGKLEALNGHFPTKDITFENMDFSDGTALEIAKHLKALPGLENLRFENVGISDEGLDAILQAIRPAPHLKNLTLDCATTRWGDEHSLGEKALPTLTSWLESDDCQLTYLDVKRNLNGPTASRIIEAVGRNRSLSGLSAQFTAEFTTQAAQEIARALPPDTNLTMINIGAYVHRDDQNTIIAPTPEALAEYAEAALKVMGKNATRIAPATPAVETATRLNSRATVGVINHFNSAESEHPEPDFDARVSMLVRSKMLDDSLGHYFKAQPNQQPIYEAYRDHQLAPIDVQIVTLESLVTPDEKGFAPLDRPGVWAQFDEIVAALEAKGTPLTPEFLQTPSPHDGIAFLEHGIAGFGDRVVPFLVEHDYPVGALLFGDDHHTPTALLERCLKQGQLPEIFQQDHTGSITHKQLHAVAGHVPDEDMDFHLPNRHTLSSAISRHQRSLQKSSNQL